MLEWNTLNSISAVSKVELSHPREHRFKHSLQDTLNPFCNCGCETATATHRLIHFPINQNELLINS